MFQLLSGECLKYLTHENLFHWTIKGTPFFVHASKYFNPFLSHLFPPPPDCSCISDSFKWYWILSVQFCSCSARNGPHLMPVSLKLCPALQFLFSIVLCIKVECHYNLETHSLASSQISLIWDLGNDRQENYNWVKSVHWILIQNRALNVMFYFVFCYCLKNFKTSDSVIKM